MRAWRVPYPKFGAGPGLKRTAAIAQEMGVDLAALGSEGAAIVGSNGKGSTAAMTASILRATGASVGLFTSPHLFVLNERFSLNGEDIGDDELEHHWGRVAGAARRAGLDGELGGFEFLFLIAADWFEARGAAHTIWEAGIGGRLDPVRLIEARRAALTSLDLEHTELLGDTLEAIAIEKIAVAPAGATLFVGEDCLPQWNGIEAHCAANGVRPVLSAALRSSPSPLAGEHQRGNAALAVRLAGDVRAISVVQAANGLARTRWPGRLETLDRAPLLVIDVGHTPRGVVAALEGFNALRGAAPGLLILGVSADKSAADIVGALAPGFATIICAAAWHKGAPAAQIAHYAAAANPGAEIVLAENLGEARTLALAKARANGAAIYVAGGLFLAAEFRAIHLGRDPAALAFF